MTPENFVYWLKGYFEVSQHLDGPKTLNEKQVEEIQNHLKLVMTKVTPDLSAVKDTQVVIPQQTIFPQFYCSTADFSQMLSGPISEVIACGVGGPTFLDQFKIDEEERKKLSPILAPMEGPEEPAEKLIT